MTGLEKFKQIVDRHNKTDAKEIHKAVDMLCAKGVANGCYQNYATLCNILEVLSAFEAAVAEKEN